MAVKPPNAWKTSSLAIEATKSECASCTPGCLGSLSQRAGAAALGKLHLVSPAAPEEGDLLSAPRGFDNAEALTELICITAGATALGKLHLVSLAAPEEAEREGDRSLPALIACLQVGAHCPYKYLYLNSGTFEGTSSCASFILLTELSTWERCFQQHYGIPLAICCV